MRKQAYILHVFAYVLDIFAAFPYPIMEAASGRLHNSGPAAFGRRPTVVESIMGYGKAANMSKTWANTYKTYACFRILPILSYSLYVAPGAIHLAESAAP